MLLAGMADRLGNVVDFEVALTASNCRDYRSALNSLKVDLLITDLGLPDGDGTELIRETRARWPDVDIVVFTVFGDEARVVQAIRCGATGYLLKDDNENEMLQAIAALRNGEAPISPGIARFLIKALQQPEAELEEPFTPREADVLRLAAKGFSNREIADLLEISANTVASHTKQIYQKLAVNSRNEAIYEAMRLGVLR